MAAVAVISHITDMDIMDTQVILDMGLTMVQVPIMVLNRPMGITDMDSMVVDINI